MYVYVASVKVVMSCVLFQYVYDAVYVPVSVCASLIYISVMLCMWVYIQCSVYMCFFGI